MSIAIKKTNKLFKFAKIISLKKIILFFLMFLFFNVFYKEAFSEERGQNIYSVFKSISLSLFVSEVSSVSVSESKDSPSPVKKHDGLLKKSLKKLKWKNSKHNTRKKMVSTDANKKTATAKGKRGLANTPSSCSDNFTDEYTLGSVSLGYKVCKSISDDKDLCTGAFHVEPNVCEGDTLIRFYCDKKLESLVTFEEIKCSKGCSEGRCKK